MGNLLFNGTGLLLLPDLFGMHWIYMASVPILFSNVAYVLFVMTLLKIHRDKHPQLYRLGVALVAILAGLIVLALFMPHWSLEIDRYGVGLFLIYGLAAGLVRSSEGSVIAQLYLAAIGTFFVLGIITISSSKLSFNTIYIELYRAPGVGFGGGRGYVAGAGVDSSVYIAVSRERRCAKTHGTEHDHCLYRRFDRLAQSHGLESSTGNPAATWQSDFH